MSLRPPLGKAAAQFDIWRQAVATWAVDGGAAPALPILAARLRELHRSVQPVPCAVDINASDLAAFLSGFASAGGFAEVLAAARGDDAIEAAS